MNTTVQTADHRGLTYLKGALFLLPAAVAWGFAATFLFPKILQVWQDLGIAASNVPAARVAWLVGGLAFSIRHAGLLVLALVGCVALLEWGSKHWAQHRRAAVIALVFVLNFAVIAGLTLMCVAALIPMPLLARTP
jgi:hypothetical protein